MGLVCFRVKGDNALNKKLLANINDSGKLHMVPASIHGQFIIRFCVCAQDAKDSDIEYAWNVITDFATDLLNGEVALSKSVMSLNGLDSCDEEMGHNMDQLEISELMDLMETVQFPIQKRHRKPGSWLHQLGTRVRRMVKNADSH
jgi:aromatic-L-amino-acid decarboxylase